MPSRGFVVGMHRTGTSAVTKLLGDAGVPLGRDLIGAGPANPLGHWESETLVVCNELVLELEGSSWWAPRPGPGPTDATFAFASRARVALDEVHDGAGWVAKDPRVCLTLPFWRHAYADDLACLFVVRSPAAVARSLHSRDRLELDHGLLVWEHYVRQALRDMRGLMVWTLDFDDLLDGSAAALSAVRGFCEALGHEGPAAALATRASTSLVQSLRHWDESVGVALTPEQERLVAALRGMASQSQSFEAPDAGAPSPMLSDYFALCRMRPSGAGVAAQPRVFDLDPALFPRGVRELAVDVRRVVDAA